MTIVRFATAGFALFSTLTFGAEPESADSIPAASEAVLFQEIAPIVGASKYEQKPIEAPSSVTVITAEEIRTFGYRTLAEVLNSVRGFFITYDRNYSYAGIRGFGRPGDYNSRLLLLVDGHRINDNVYDSALIGSEFPLDLEVVDRVEVVRGPSSSLYGTNAFFAVVNVITKNGRALEGFAGLAGGGSAGLLNGSAAYGNRLANGVELLVSGSFYQTQGRSLYFPEFDGQGASNGWATNRDGDRAEKFFFKVSRGDFHAAGAYGSREKDIPTASFGTDFNSGTERTTDGLGFLRLGYDHDFGTDRKVAVELSYNAYDYEGLYPYAGVSNRDLAHGNSWGVESDLVQQIGKRNKLVTGIELRDNTRQDQSNYDVSPYALFLDSRESSRNWAVFGQDEITVGDSWLLNFGARYDHYDSFGGTVNPRISAIWRVRETTAVKLLIGGAFRAPNNYELFYSNINQRGNPDARPETIHSAELVVESSRGQRHFVGTLYQYRLKDLISLTVDPTDGFLTYRNVDSVRAEGLELALNGRLAARLDGRLSYSLQQSRNELTDETLDNSPRHLAKAALSLPVWREALFGTLEAQYTSSTRATSGAHTGSATVLNVGLHGRPRRSGFDLAAWVYNVTDEDYFHSAGEEHVQELIQQDGRTYRLVVRYAY